MAKYCQEKFENTTGAERIVYWRQDKHVHDARMIGAIQRALEAALGGTWSVRANSYQSNQQRAPDNGVEWDRDSLDL
jgi:hypothetical protein